jgi:ligand-binding sensor domain-containing protein
MTHVTAAGTSLAQANGSTVDRVDQLFEDRQRVLWISTERGVFRFDGNQLSPSPRILPWP